MVIDWAFVVLHGRTGIPQFFVKIPENGFNLKPSSSDVYNLKLLIFKLIGSRPFEKAVQF